MGPTLQVWREKYEKIVYFVKHGNQYPQSRDLQQQQITNVRDKVKCVLKYAYQNRLFIPNYTPKVLSHWILAKFENN